MGALCDFPSETMPWDKYTDCGIPRTGMWETNGSADVTLPASEQKFTYDDRFYKYGNLHGDAETADAQKEGHFGNKVLALSVRWHPEAAWQQGYVRNLGSRRHGNGPDRHIVAESRQPDR